MSNEEFMTVSLLAGLIVGPLIMAIIVVLFYEIRYRTGLTWQRRHEMLAKNFGGKL